MAYRLGDVIDDYCTRCRMISNNAIEAMLGEEIVKVRCRTCNYSHDYRHGQLPEKAKPRKASLKSAFDTVLASVMAGRNPESEQKPKKPAASNASRTSHAATHHGLHTLASARKKSGK